MIVPVLLVVVGGAALAWGLAQCRRTLRAARWPAAEGEVLAARIIVTPVGDGGASYEPHVTYRYVVGGETFVGQRLRLEGVWEGTEAAAAEWLRDYPRGRAVRVRYRPEDPRDAVLDATVSGGLVAAIGLGAAGVLAGAALLAASR